ncbi:MAG: AAA family ATPase, partial [bacterium]
MRIQKITIEGFRGFNEKQTIHLDHDIVLIYGLNGSGKSSLVEALEWLFFEDISRRDRSACPSEYMSNYLRNVHYVGPSNPFVEATVLLNGVQRVVRKELVGVRGQCCYVDGAETEDFSCLGVSLESHSKPILSQGEIRSFVDTEQKARWEEVSSILGLKVFAELRADLQSLRSKIHNREEYQKALKQRDAVLVRLRNKGWLPTVVDVAGQTPYDHSQIVNTLKKALSDSLGREVELEEAGPIIRERKEAILKKVREPEALKLLELEARDLPETKAADLLSDIHVVIGGFEDLNAQSVQQEYVRFLHLGLSLLDGSTCPFCQEDTISEAKERQLRERLASDQTTLKAIERLESQIQETRKKSMNLDETLTRQVPDVARLGLAATKLQKEQPWHSEGAEVRALIERDIPPAKDVIRETGLAIKGLQHTFTSLLHAEIEFEPDELRKKADTVEHKLSAAMAVIDEIRDSIEEVRSSIVSKTEDLSEDEKSEFEFLGYLSELIGLLRFFRTAGAYERRLEVLTRLIEKAEVFEKHKTAELLDTLSGEVRRYYEKLNPAEAVQFREIVPSSGKSRQVRLKAESYGEELNPVTCFSEAHMNSLGISLYFPQRVDHNPEWEFAMLDDPIQS